MTTSTLLDVVLGLAIIGYLGSRQLRWRPLEPARMWRLPLVLGVAGVLTLGHHPGLTPVDVAILAGSAIAAIGCGLAMGRVTRVRPAASGGLESRAGWAGVGAWVLLIALRVLLGVAGHHLGSALATSTGVILLTVALSLAATTVVVSARLPRHPAPVAGR
jgi:hypothetical protein